MKLSVLLGLGLSSSVALALESPNKRLDVSVFVNADKTLSYSVKRDGQAVLLPSPLGLKLAGADFSHGLKLVDSSPVRLVSDQYEMAVGKRREIQYRANEQVYSLVNSAGNKIDVAFRVSDDGVAFRYIVADSAIPTKRFISEATGFAFDAKTRAFLQPMAVAKSGWGKTNPSYEEHYQVDIPVGRAAPLKSGWVFPALFRSGDTWVALTEANMDGGFHASRLATSSTGGVYRIDGPTPKENFTGGKLLAETKGTLTTPWRVIALGALDTVMNSTLGTDLAAPAVRFDPKLVQPGHASWSWPLLKDGATVFEVQKKFIDYAVDMKWDYTLVDAEWDKQIGYDKMAELAGYGAAKGVGLLAWYNSAGAWNTAPQTPRDKLLTHEARVKEFARLRSMGFKGIKVDFFGGDGVSMIKYYVDILNDAADAGLLVNFHGATLPRGLERTYPNLMTAEAIRGFEFTTFDQKDHDVVPGHAVNAAMIRNLFDPMDYTPMVFGEMGQIKRITRNGFELAQSVLFLSGIQHFAEVPEGMATVPEYVRGFLRELPRRWDDSRFLAGYPGSHVVVARKAGSSWYVAGINADQGERTIELDLSFIGGRKGVMITDGAGQREFSQKDLASGKARVTIKPRGGFVAVFR
ncbi:glycoside hydrolase family 97 N-terminal domain-containing protein [Pseudoduganella sp. HUAS MS19]